MCVRVRVCVCPYPPSVQPGRGWSPAAAACSSPSVWTSAPSASTEMRNAPERAEAGPVSMISGQYQTRDTDQSVGPQVQSHLGIAVSALQQDLVVEGFPLGVVRQCHGELAQAGDEVLGHPLLVGLRAPGSVFQLITLKDRLTLLIVCRKSYSPFWRARSRFRHWESVTWSRSGLMRVSARSLLRNR